jgi:hypothetical protein
LVLPPSQTIQGSRFVNQPIEHPTSASCSVIIADNFSSVNDDNTKTINHAVYTLRIMPSIINIRSTLPKPFKIRQTLQNTMLHHVNETLTQANHYLEEVNSTVLRRGEQNYFTSSSASLYRDISGKCLYQHIAAVQNQLQLRTWHDKVVPTRNWDLKNGFTEKCD